VAGIEERRGGSILSSRGFGAGVFGSLPEAIVCDDLDLDGEPDLATCNAGSRDCSILWGR